MATINLLHRGHAFVHRQAVSVGALSVRPQSSRTALQIQKVHGLLHKGARCLIAALCFAAAQGALATDFTIHVRTTDFALAQDILAQTTTGYYLGTFTKSATFANTWTVSVTGKNPNYKPPLPLTFVSAQDLLNALVRVSTSTYPYGWADGIEYGRGYDLSRISNYIVQCGTPSVFGATAANWDRTICTTALMCAEQDIYNTKFSSPTVVPGY